MKICRVNITNFRGIQFATVFLPQHSVLIGDNNTGKTTILEALDLVLGPDRLSRNPPIDEHDFYLGNYLIGGPEQPTSKPHAGVEVVPEDPTVEQKAPKIEIEATITDLSDEQKARFGDDIEFWDASTNSLYSIPNPEGVDSEFIGEALRVTFIGQYEPEEDDFKGNTYYTRSLTESESPVPFTKKDKQFCGFLYLRSVRTGSRALSLERGSLLDIILRQKEVRPRMWEDTISSISGYSVASDPELGISGVLESINAALKKYVPKEWGVEPHLKVSNLTRENLRKVITAFIATGEGGHSAPFYRQGTGTINMLVLALLSLIAEGKQNVIFAMEEPETAIPPYAQKRIVHEVRKLASQTIFTSHSPYILEEFALDETLVLRRDNKGVLSQSMIALPDSVKPKRYRMDFRTRFCEGLLARRVLIAEGATEAAAFPVACRRLTELDPTRYAPLEALGISTVDAGGEKSIPDLSALYKNLGKETFAFCDKQSEENKALIEAQVDRLFMHEEKGIEDLVLKNTTMEALSRFALAVEWPSHLKGKYPSPQVDLYAAVSEYFQAKKADLAVADFLAQCTENEIPGWIRDACMTLKTCCSSQPKLEVIEARAESGGEVV